MEKVITQETFDDIVKENIIDFSMTVDEARDETIKQFEAQGVNLINIVKNLSINSETGRPVLNEAIDSLKNYTSDENNLSYDELKKNLQILDSECKKSVAHRVLAAKNGANEILLLILNKTLSTTSLTTTTKPSDNQEDKSNSSTNTTNETFTANNDTVLYCLEATNSILDKYPDLFNEDALKIIINILENTEKYNEKILCSTLQWLQKACIMHEMNRQLIMNSDILKYLKSLMFMKNGKILRDVCTVFRYLILDDDIRIQFSKSHDHARIIASEVLIDLTKLLPEFTELDVLCDLILTIASLIVRHEFCIAVEKAGGLKFILELIFKNQHSIKLNREALKLIRALAGHDEIKGHIIQQGAATIIRDLLITHKSNESLVATGLLSVSTLTLRNKENSLEFFKVNLPEIIMEVLKLYPKSKIIQRNGSWAIRNMVSRLREHNDSFLVLGAEEVLNSAMKEHPSIEHDIKAALRDLGCDVHLKEEWTGKAKIKISN